MGKEADKCYSWLPKKLADDVLGSEKNFLCGSLSIKHEREKHNVQESVSYSEARCNIM